MTKELVYMLKNGGNWNAQVDYTRPLKEELAKTLGSFESKVEELNIYLMEKKSYKYQISGDKVMNVFVQITPFKSYNEETIVINVGNSYAVNALASTELEGDPSVIEDENGTAIAYYFEEYEEVYIPLVLETIPFEDAMKITEYIMQKVLKEFLAEKANNKSWLKTRDKDKLRKQIIEHLSSGKEDKIKEKKDRLEREKREIESYQRRIKEGADRIKGLSQELISIEKGGIEGIEEFMDGLDLISNFPDVSNVIVERNMVHIHVDNVHATTYLRGKDRTFYIGNMVIKINMANSEVRFDGDNKRRGYWANDPHPHVSGADGSACLGNVSTTVAQLCSDMKIYPLFLVCLDFLRSANPEDSAGRHIVNWDEVGDDGKVIETDSKRCDNCGERTEHLEEVHTVWDGDDFVDIQDWCEDCVDEHSTFNYNYDVRVSDSAQEDYE